jgi:hypothetical protein
MLHELWIGEARQSSLKHKLLGRLQRGILKDLLHRLTPEVVHTHTPLYVHLLSKLGYHAIKLPLFGNVPIQADISQSQLDRLWSYAGWSISEAERDRWSIFVIFGSIHPEWDGMGFIEQALQSTHAAGKQMAFIAIGRLGDVGEKKWEQFESHYATLCKLLLLREQSAEIISQCLLAADFGVSAVPPEYLFKSGSAVAMLEHGLSVLTTRPVGNYTGCPEEMLQEKLPHSFTRLDFEKMTKLKPRELLPEVAAQFVQNLERAAEGKRIAA